MTGRRMACLAGVVWLTAAPAQAAAGLRGNVLDPSGAAIAGAVVAVVHEDTGFRRLTQSQADGSYLLWPLHPGAYKVTVRKEGFRTLIRFGVRLAGPQADQIDFTLPIGSMQESITVEGTPPLLRGETPALETRIGRDALERLPVNGRSLSNLLELAAGSVLTPATRGEAGQFTVNGQRPNAHYFTVDGVHMNSGVSAGGLPAQITGGALPGVTAFGSLHSIAPLDATDEVRMETSVAAFDFGRRTGAQVAIQSRSGTNEFHGSLFQDWRHEALAANDWFANRHGARRAPLRLHNFGGTAGGPLLRNRTFFFAAYEGVRMRQPSAWRAPVPSAALREQIGDWVRPLVEFFPLPNGEPLDARLAEWTGRNLQPSGLDSGSLRLDHALTKSISVFGRYHGAPSASEFGSAQINRLDLRSASVTAGMHWQSGSRLTMDTRVNHSDVRAASLWRADRGPVRPACDPAGLTLVERRDPQACDHLIRVSIAGVGQISSGQEGMRAQGQWYASQGAALGLGRHQLRLGADYLRLTPRFDDRAGTFGVMAESLDDLISSQNLWTSYSERRQGRVSFQQAALFAHDTWQPLGSLTVSYGLRWDFGPATVTRQPGFVLDPGRGRIVSVDEVAWPLAFSRVGPRAGVAYRWGAQGRTVLRAGGGLFFDSSPGVATDAVNAGPLNAQQFGSGRFAPFSGLLSFGFPPAFRLPGVRQWNAGVEHEVTPAAVLSVSYAGSAGRQLVRREMGGLGSSTTLRLAVATNHGAADYHALQAQYRRKLSGGWQALVSYAWGHSIDNSSTDALLHWAGPGFLPRQDRGSSDFDVRHTATAALSYAFHPGARGWRAGWSVDSIVRARTGFPLDVLDAEQPMGLQFANVFRADRVAGQPVWLADAAAPGGRKLNRAAFARSAPGRQGSLGRNVLTGFGLLQVDLALRKDLFSRERRAVQFRLDAYNALNRPNLADPVRYLANPLFGEAASMLNLMLGTGSPGSGLAPMFQPGGARTVQAGLRWRF